MKTFKQMMSEKVIEYSKQDNLTRINDMYGKRLNSVKIDGEVYTYNKVHKTYNSKTNTILSKTMIDNARKLDLRQ